MELKELVNQTLTGIIEGVMAAQEQCKQITLIKRCNSILYWEVKLKAGLQMG